MVVAVTPRAGGTAATCAARAADAAATGQRAGGAPNALCALATIFLPINRLPTPPTTAPMPTGSILPNASAPALERVALDEVLQQPRVQLRQRRQRQRRGAVGHPRAAGAAGTDEVGHRALAVLADEHRQHQRAAPLTMLGRDAVHLRDGEHEDARSPPGTPRSRRRRPTSRPACRCRGTRPPSRPPRRWPSPRPCTACPACRRSAPGVAPGLASRSRSHVGLHGGGLHAGAAFDDLGKHLGGDARILVDDRGQLTLGS